MGQSKLDGEWYCNVKLNTYFCICIPVYNAEKYIDGCLQSIFDQTFNDFQIVLVDDYSTDGSSLKLAEWAGKDNRVHVIPRRKEKLYNGGSRNFIVDYIRRYFNCEYILCLDADDKFVDKYALASIYACAERPPRKPDMIRLPYNKKYVSGRVKYMDLSDEKGIEDITWSKRVAAWTKAIRPDKFQDFPENTLFEDVCQHLKQCDVTQSVAWVKRAIVEWNVHDNSTSRNNSPKWKSSMYRFVADLMDLELNKPYTINRRDVKVQGAKKGIKKGIAVQ